MRLFYFFILRESDHIFPGRFNVISPKIFTFTNGLSEVFNMNIFLINALLFFVLKQFVIFSVVIE